MMTQEEFNSFVCYSNNICHSDTYLTNGVGTTITQDLYNQVYKSFQSSPTLDYEQSGEFFGVGVGLFISFFIIGKSVGLVLKLIREG